MIGINIGINKRRRGAGGGAAYTYLLDSYPADQATAMNLLSSTYSGPLIRVRESGGNTEKDFYADGTNWITMDSEDGAGTSLSTFVGANSGFVVTRYDQTGNGKHETWAVSVQQPRIVNAGTLDVDNGRAAVHFTEGSLHRLAFTESFASGGNAFAFVVFNPDDTTGHGMIGNATTPGWVHWIDVSGNLKFRTYDGANSDLTDTATAVQQQVTLAAISSTAQRMWRDGTLLQEDLTFGTMSAKASFSYGIGTYDTASGAATVYLNGYFQVHVLYKSDQTANREAIEAIIKNFYSTP